MKPEDWIELLVAYGFGVAVIFAIFAFALMDTKRNRSRVKAARAAFVVAPLWPIVIPLALIAAIAYYPSVMLRWLWLYGHPPKQEA